MVIININWFKVIISINWFKVIINITSRFIYTGGKLRSTGNVCSVFEFIRYDPKLFSGWFLCTGRGLRRGRRFGTDKLGEGDLEDKLGEGVEEGAVGEGVEEGAGSGFVGVGRTWVVVFVVLSSGGLSVALMKGTTFLKKRRFRFVTLLLPSTLIK